MPIVILSQTDMPATTLTDVYVHGTTRPDAIVGIGNCVIRGLTVCNRNATQISFRLAVSMAGAAIANKQYLFYDSPVLPNETFNAQTLIPLEMGDVVRVYTSAADVSVQIHGEY